MPSHCRPIDKLSLPLYRILTFSAPFCQKNGGYNINRWVARPGPSDEKLTIFSLQFCGDMLLFTCQNVLHFWDFKGAIKKNAS